MSDQKNNGGPAFPSSDAQAAHTIAAAAAFDVTDSAERDRIYTAARAQAQQGMTLRDYFAAHAPEVPDLQTYPIKQWSVTEIVQLTALMKGPRQVLKSESWAARSSRWAFEYADAMIAERAK